MPPERDVERLFFDENPLPMWVFDAESLAFLAVNGAAIARYGYSREDFLAMTLRDIRPQEDVGLLLEAVAAPRPDRSVHRSVRHRTRSGEIIHVEIAAHEIDFEGRRARIVVALDVTERVRTEAAQRESDARFRAIFEQAAVGVAVTSLEGRVQLTNRRFADLVGATPDELVGASIADLTYPADLDADLAEFERLKAGEIPSYQIDKRYLRRDGGIVWARLSVSLVRDEHGGPLSAMAVVEDISARKRNAEALRRKTDRLAAIIDAQQEIAAATLDLDTALPRILERAQAVTGANAAAIGRVGDGDVVYEFATGSAAPHAPFRTSLQASLSGSALRAGRLLRCADVEADPRVDRALLRRLGSRSAAALPLVYNGVTLGVLLIAAPSPGAFGDDEGQALHLFGGMLAAAMSHARELEARQRTIAERTAALAALRDREEQYRLVTDGVPLLISYVDAGERYRFVNRAYELAFGVTRDQLVGRRVADVLGATYPRVRSWIEATLRGERVSYVTLLALPGGGTRRVSVTHVPRFDDAGAVVGYLVMATDLTEHDRLEQQFRQAQKMEAIGKLAGGVAHDFNNILCVITSISHLLLDEGGLTAEQRADVAEVRRAAERATDLTRKLLAFGRRQTLQPRVLDLNATVHDAEKMLRRLIREDVQLVPRLDATIGRVHADPAQLEQVLLNLVLNARDAMPSGGRIVVETADVVLDEEFVRGHPGATAGRHVRLAVSDTGSGMSGDVLARAFEPFFTTKEQGKGTGLGLAIVYGVVKQSGGFVDIESRPGSGTTVTVYLPRVDAGLELVRQDPPRPPGGGSETVLLVEDEESVRLVASRVLEERGYRVLCARHGREALGVAAAQPGEIDLLVTDVVMPEMGGRDLAARLTSLRPELPVLFTSGYAADELGDQGVLGREVAFVQKPFTPDALARAVREALDARWRAPL